MVLLSDATRDALSEQLEALPQGEVGEHVARLRDAMKETLGDLHAPGFVDRTLPEQMEIVHRAQGLARLCMSGVELDDAATISMFVDESLQTTPSLGVDPELIRSLARRVYDSADAVNHQPAIICGSKGCFEVLAEIVRLCVEDDVDFRIVISNDVNGVTLLNGSTDEGLEALANFDLALFDDVGVRITARHNLDPSLTPDTSKMQRMGALTRSVSDRIRRDEMHFSLTVVPTAADAELDDMSYDDYMTLFFESCDQPWEAVTEAQWRLVDKLNAGKEIRIVNDDGTDATFGVDGFTFANSHVEKNTPGSEVFSAPNREGVNGRIVAKGKFKYDEYPVVEDITLVFENGRIVDFSARVGEDTLKAIIEADDANGEGTRFLGELAFGTNPHLQSHMVNGLLVEKIAGSFHVAVGDSYEFTEFNGRPVHLDNGNRSYASIHWDIATMLRGRGGKVYVDGQLIQDDGLWVDESGRPDPDLSVLNYGWGALPEVQRPQWFRDKFPRGYLA